MGVDSVGEVLADGVRFWDGHVAALDHDTGAVIISDDLVTEVSRHNHAQFRKLEPNGRLFKLERYEDINGVSGEGTVAVGCELSDGQVAYRWRSNPRTTQIAEKLDVVRRIHGHGDRTKVLAVHPSENV